MLALIMVGVAMVIIGTIHITMVIITTIGDTTTTGGITILIGLPTIMVDFMAIGTTPMDIIIITTPTTVAMPIIIIEIPTITAGVYRTVPAEEITMCPTIQRGQPDTVAQAALLPRGIALQEEVLR